MADAIREIASRASTIDERLATARGRLTLPRDVEGVAVEARLVAWRRILGDDPERFSRRLASDEANACLALAGFGTSQPDAGQLPEWAGILRWVAPAVAKNAVSTSCGQRAYPLPFEDLLWPVVRGAERRLARRLGDRWHQLFSGAARNSLSHSLLSSLSNACAPAVYAEFDFFRRMSATPGGGFLQRHEITGSRQAYEAFLVDFAGRFLDFLVERPLLARTIGTIVETWLDATGELVQRLEQDLLALTETFALGRALGKVANIQINLSDPHRGRRSVAILAFETGSRIVYKPKDMGVDAAYSELVRWLADHSAPVEIRTPRVIARDGYGWAEFIAADHCDLAVSTLYCRRAGAQLAVLYLLQATDAHTENVVISAGYPVIIDLETLLHPKLAPPLRDQLPDAATRDALEAVAESVLAAQFLPFWALGFDGRLVPMGGINGRGLPREGVEVFDQINNDAMRLRRGAQKTSYAAERPSENTPPAALDADAVAAGFSDMYAFLIGHRNTLAAPNGSIERFRGLRVRAVLRATADYGLVTQRAARIANKAKDGADWSLSFDALGRHISSSAPECAWRLFGAERRALARLDIPFFTVVTDGTWIESCDGERIDDCLVEAPIDGVLRRVAELSEENLAKQLGLVTAALNSQALAQAAPQPRPQVKVDEGSALNVSARAAARRIGQTLDQTAFHKSGGIAWLGVTPIDHDHTTIAVVSTDLCAGTIGIAVFLSALARVAEDPRAGRLSRAAVASARRIHASLGPRSAQHMGIGGGSGLGSVIYGLVRIADLLDETAPLDDALQLSKVFTQERIAADRVYGVLHGAAGAILGLLALFHRTGDTTVLERAVLCGRHLLMAQVADNNGHKAWRTRRDTSTLFTGFSHGAAGIALALARLYTETGTMEFHQAAVDAIRFERSASLSARKGFDHHCHLDSDGSQRQSQWCFGAPGIGLARLGMLGLLDESGLSDDIDAALAGTLTEPARSSDSLCCGELGRIEFLLVAGSRLKRVDLIGEARKRIALLLAQSQKAGGFRIEGQADDLNPALFRGISGIGYQLLRITDPDALPSVLLWE